MEIPYVSLLYVIPFTVMLVVLSAMVVQQRAKHQVIWGDGGKPRLLRAIRVHANFCEYMPWAYMLLLVFDMTGSGSTNWIHGLAGTLFFARLIHAIGLHSKDGTPVYIFGRAFGTIITWAVMLLTAFKLCAHVHGS